MARSGFQQHLRKHCTSRQDRRNGPSGVTGCSNRLLRCHWAVESTYFVALCSTGRSGTLCFASLCSTGGSKTQGLTHYARQHFEFTFEVTFEVTALLRTHFVPLHRRREAPYANLVCIYIHICHFIWVSFWRCFDLGVTSTWVTLWCLWNLGAALIWASLLFLCVVWVSLYLGVTLASL